MIASFLHFSAEKAPVADDKFFTIAAGTTVDGSRRPKTYPEATWLPCGVNRKIFAMFCKNALVVDDSLTARTVLKHHLNQFDVVVESAPDGSHALELLRTHTPDVIFLDHVMPGLNGFEVLARLKNNRFTKNIPVVMYTSQAAPQYTMEAKSLGAIAVIPKEVTDEQLMEALDKAELYRLKAANDSESTEPAAGPLWAEAPKAAIVYADDAANDDSASPAPALPTPNAMSDRPAGTAVPGVDRASDKVVSLPATSRANRQSDAWNATGFVDRKVNGGDTERPYSPPVHARARDWRVAVLLAAFLLAEGHGALRDREQQRAIAELRQQLLLQQQAIPEIQGQLVSQQRKLTEETWRQLEFLVNILLDQIQSE